jgi:hypothetical protein
MHNRSIDICVCLSDYQFLFFYMDVPEAKEDEEGKKEGNNKNK